MLEALGTYWDCARRPVVQASVVLGALGPHWDAAGCAHTADFCNISPFTLVVSLSDCSSHHFLPTCAQFFPFPLFFHTSPFFSTNFFHCCSQ